MFKLLESHQARLATLRRWASLSSQVAGMQMLVQGVSAVTGLLLIRAMEKDAYAWFTLAASMLATLHLLADGGTSTALTSIGGRVYQNAAEFSRLMADGRRMALRLALIGIVLSAPFFWHLYTRLGAPPVTTAALLGLAIVGMAPAIIATILGVSLRLHSRARQAQGAELFGACVRLLLCGGLLWVGWADARAMFAGTIFASLCQAWMLRKNTREYTAPPRASTGHQSEITSFVRALYGNHIFFCLQGQIATWLIGWLAGVEQVADLGALSRLAVLFAAFGAPFTHLVAPSMARIQDTHILRRRFALAIGTAFAGTAVLLAAAAWKPGWFLWLLGEKYANLGPELTLALASQGVGMIAGICWGLMVVRGWVSHAWLNILLSCLGYVLGAAFMPLDTVAGVLKMNLLASMPLLCWVLLRCWRRLSIR
ncbi:MAG TPA: hypothetical protein DIT13_13655 [Verrucomicrobiales bacterium]|nr:hypothetical protein [Verrucomicrobiales bacterium]HRJ09072.1 hypothetical protein [Prosthecobacter sp.]HRK14157.1 hypothetical protein [Prosthecobacter sp.]